MKVLFLIFFLLISSKVYAAQLSASCSPPRTVGYLEITYMCDWETAPLGTYGTIISNLDSKQFLITDDLTTVYVYAICTQYGYSGFEMSNVSPTQCYQVSPGWIPLTGTVTDDVISHGVTSIRDHLTASGSFDWSKTISFIAGLLSSSAFVFAGRRFL